MNHYLHGKNIKSLSTSDLNSRRFSPKFKRFLLLIKKEENKVNAVQVFVGTSSTREAGKELQWCFCGYGQNGGKVEKRRMVLNSQGRKEQERLPA